MGSYGSNILGIGMRVYYGLDNKIIAIDHIEIMETSRVLQKEGSFIAGEMKYDRVKYPSAFTGDGTISKIRMFGDLISYDQATGLATWDPSGSTNQLEIDCSSLGMIGDTV